MAPNTHAANATKCAMYGQFLHATSHTESNIIYWLCFIVVLATLIMAAVFFAKSRERQASFELAAHETYWHPNKCHPPHKPATPLPTLQLRHTRAQRRSLYGSLICSILMIPIVIIEALAGLSINFCHQEDLIMFYWGLFFLLSVGSLIATWGLFLSQSIENEPAWNVALGTPVLVFAAVGHWCCAFCGWAWKRVWANKDERERSEKKAQGKKEKMPPKYLPHCPDCQEGQYLAMSLVPSQESQAPLVMRRPQAAQIPTTTSIATGVSTPESVKISEAINRSPPQIRIQEPEPRRQEDV